jgi:DNA polymerase III epsilon subunit family exonuclease
MPDFLTPDIFKKLKLDEFVSLDLETTGLDYLREDIIEFGAVKYKNGDPVDNLNFLLKPTKKIPPHITRITGISDKDVEREKSFNQVLAKIQNFLGENPIIAHNVNFDLPFLEYHARKSNNNFIDWDYQQRVYHYFNNPKIDTLLLARIFLFFLPSTSLSNLKKYFQIDTKEKHRALSDAQATGEIFLELLQIALKSKLADIQKILQILEPTEDALRMFFENLAVLQSSGQLLYKAVDQISGGIDRESFTINANFYNIIGEGETPEHGRMETESIDEQTIAGFFDDAGELSQEFASFEIRKPQVNMARAVAQAFNESKFLVVEAGTGTGKSMAYLVPAIKWATKNYGPNGRIIISTNTKNLQEQLFFKDIPILHGVLKDRFKAVLLKGKGNYLCLDKWVTVLNDMKFRLSEKERTRILPLYFWTQQTKTGDIAENNAFHAERNMGLWTKLIAENNYCPGRSCKFYDKCFLMKTRNNARNAHIVLVNHSLLFSDLAAENAVLSDYVNVIFDEAHNIEKTATEYLGVETSFNSAATKNST